MESRRPEGQASSTRKRDLSAFGAAATGAGAAALATAATACCVPVLAPLLVSVLGVSASVWAAGLQPYSWAILGLAAVLLGYGFWVVYRNRAGGDRACSTRRPVAVRGVLWLAAILWASALALNLYQLLISRIG